MGIFVHVFDVLECSGWLGEVCEVSGESCGVVLVECAVSVEVLCFAAAAVAVS